MQLDGQGRAGRGQHQPHTTNQCELAGVSRATLYAHQKPKLIDAEDLLLCALIDEEYTRHPFYGSRRMVVILARAGHIVNRKRVQRLMRQMGLVGMAPGPNTSRPHPGHKVYPYLLRGVYIDRPNQVWSTDITSYGQKTHLSHYPDQRRQPRAKPLDPACTAASPGEHDPSALPRTLSGYAETVGRRLGFFDHTGFYV